MNKSNITNILLILILLSILYSIYSNYSKEEEYIPIPKPKYITIILREKIPPRKDSIIYLPLKVSIPKIKLDSTYYHKYIQLKKEIDDKIFDIFNVKEMIFNKKSKRYIDYFNSLYIRNSAQKNFKSPIKKKKDRILLFAGPLVEFPLNTTSKHVIPAIGFKLDIYNINKDYIFSPGLSYRDEWYLTVGFSKLIKLKSK